MTGICAAPWMTAFRLRTAPSAGLVAVAPAVGDPAAFEALDADTDGVVDTGALVGAVDVGVETVATVVAVEVLALLLTLCAEPQAASVVRATAIPPSRRKLFETDMRPFQRDPTLDRCPGSLVTPADTSGQHIREAKRVATRDARHPPHPGVLTAHVDPATSGMAVRYPIDIALRMAMTLRLPEDDKRVLAHLAAEDGISRQEATIRAIHEVAERRGHEHPVTDASRRARARYVDVLQRHWLATVVFLDINDCWIEAPDDDSHDVVIAVDNGTATLQEIAKALAAWH